MPAISSVNGLVNTKSLIEYLKILKLDQVNF